LSNVRNWLEKFLFEFRKQYDSLSEDEKSAIANIDNFMPPCQMLFLHFENVNFQYLIVTHDKNRKDGEITVYGPIPTYEAVDVLDSILKDPKWDRELTKEDKRYLWNVEKFRDVLEQRFLYIITELRSSPFIKPGGPTLIGAKITLTARSFIWYIRGNITDLDPAKIVDKIIQDARKRIKDFKTVKKPVVITPPQTSIRGFGTYFYPPIWIGEAPRKTFKEKALGIIILPEKAFDTTYKEKVVVVNNNGYIAIGEEDYSKAFKMLNEIMATGLLFDLPFFAARDLDISKVGIDPFSLTISSWGSGESPLKELLFYEEMGRTDLFFSPLRKRREVKKEKIVSLIREAERITQSPDLSDSLIFLLDAYTCLQSSEYIQSFILSWIVIERHLYRLWERFLQERQIAGKRKNKLTNPLQITIDIILETLNFAGQLSHKEYADLMDLKNKRNNIMHKGKMVTQIEAEKCFQKAKNIIRQRIIIHKKTKQSLD